MSHYDEAQKDYYWLICTVLASLLKEKLIYSTFSCLGLPMVVGPLNVCWSLSPGGGQTAVKSREKLEGAEILGKVTSKRSRNDACQE